MKRLLALLIVVAMIFSCGSMMAFADEQTEIPGPVKYANRLFFIPAIEFRQISFEGENAFIQWGVMTTFIYDIKWDETGTEVYMIVDPQEERNSSNVLINGDHMPVTILTKDNVKSLRIFDGNTYVPNDGLVTIGEDGKTFIAREYIDKGYSMFIEDNCCEAVHWNVTGMVTSTDYGKGKINHTPNCWYLDYDDIPQTTEDGAKIIYCLLPQVTQKEPPKYVDAFSRKGSPRISIVGDVKSSNGYWVYTVKVPSNFNNTIDFCFDFGESQSNHSRMGIYINPGTADPSEPAAEPEVFNVQEALDYAKITTKTSNVSKGTKVTAKIVGIDEAAFAEAGYTLKLKYYRSTKKSSGYKLMATYDFGKTYTNSKGTIGKKYYYKVKLVACDANGELVAQTALKQSTASLRTFKK